MGSTSRRNLPLSGSNRATGCIGGPGEAVVAPDEHDIDLPLSDRLEEPLVAGAIVRRAGRVVDELTHDLEPAPLRVLSELA